MSLFQLVRLCEGTVCTIDIIPFLDSKTVVIYIPLIECYALFREQGYYKFMKNLGKIAISLQIDTISLKTRTIMKISLILHESYMHHIDALREETNKGKKRSFDETNMEQKPESEEEDAIEILNTMRQIKKPRLIEYKDKENDKISSLSRFLGEIFSYSFPDHTFELDKIFYRHDSVKPFKFNLVSPTLRVAISLSPYINSELEKYKFELCKSMNMTHIHLNNFSRKRSKESLKKYLLKYISKVDGSGPMVIDFL